MISALLSKKVPSISFLDIDFLKKNLCTASPLVLYRVLYSEKMNLTYKDLLLSS